MPRFRKKSVEVDAWLFTGGEDLARKIAGINKSMHVLFSAYIVIETLEGRMTANPGDWIIRGVNGEFYPCKPDVFSKTYEIV